MVLEESVDVPPVPAEVAVPLVATVAPRIEFPSTEMANLASAPVAEEFVATALASSIELEFPESTQSLDIPSAQEAVGGPAHTEFAATQTGGVDTVFTGSEPAAQTAVEMQELSSDDLGDFDFGDLGVSKEASPVEEADTNSTETLMPDYVAEQVVVSVVEPEPEPEESVKVIGPLRLSIPLYNVYLNEADEWSRRLQVELSEWALELHEPLPDSLVSLAHSLIGSSATVGFLALSELARSLEQALQHVQLHGRGTVAHAEVFSDAAEDIRRLLHQFAAGFLKDADEGVLSQLQTIIETEFPAPTMEPVLEVMDVQPEPLHDSEFESDTVVEVEPESAVEVVEEIEPPILLSDLVAPEQIVEAPLPVEPITKASVAAAPLHVADSTDDDIDAVDNLDEDLFPIFEEEAIELMPQLGSALRQWVAAPDNLSARNEALRVLHTLKGSARLAGAMRLGEMTHRMESAIEYIGSESLQAVQLEPLLTRFDNLQAAFAALGAEPEPEVEAVAVAAPVAATQYKPTSTSQVVSEVKRLIPLPAAATFAPAKAISNQSVRVRSQLLDRLVNQAGEVMITRSRMDARLTQLKASLGELGGNLDRLRQQLRDVELQAESQMQSRLAQTKDTAQAFDPLEFDRFTRVQELTRMMAESVNDVATVQRNLQRSVEGSEDDLIAQGRQARELQRDLLRTRMVEFEAISERLYGVVRQASKDAGKAVKLDIVGGSIEMDRGVLDRMTPAFEHMLRNAVAHGIESQDARASRGKPAAGTITIHVHQESNDVSVAFSDDGGGLHLDKIRAKAIANGVINSNDHLSDGDAANLIFMPGFSTADQVTELSGRGVGMDVVRAEVSAVGGRIETSTSEGQGTTFKLVLPLTTAVTQVVMLRMGEFTIGVPSNLMETVLRAPVATLEQAYERDGFEFQGQVLPFFWAGALLQVSARSHEMKTRTMPVAVLRSAGQRMALHIDEVLGNREVVVKNSGPSVGSLARSGRCLGAGLGCGGADLQPGGAGYRVR